MSAHQEIHTQIEDARLQNKLKVLGCISLVFIGLTIYSYWAFVPLLACVLYGMILTDPFASKNYTAAERASFRNMLCLALLAAACFSYGLLYNPLVLILFALSCFGLYLETKDAGL